MKIDDYKPDFDPLEKAEQASDSVSTLVDRINTYLYGDFSCNECGGKCEATTTYSPTMCQEVRSWHCSECNKDYYRESNYTDAELPQPRER